MRRAAPDFVDELSAALAAESAVARARSPRTRGPSVWEGPQGELLETLTVRELEVLRLVAAGASNTAIAAGLGVSLGTAKWHVGHVLAKLDATNRTAGPRPCPAARSGLTQLASRQRALLSAGCSRSADPALRQARMQPATPNIEGMEHNAIHPKESSHV